MFASFLGRTRQLLQQADSQYQHAARPAREFDAHASPSCSDLAFSALVSACEELGGTDESVHVCHGVSVATTFDEFGADPWDDLDAQLSESD
jgi:hypothetical protein